MRSLFQISLLLVLCLCCYLGASAQHDATKTPDLVITERTGHAGREFFRRGIPFAEGELTSETGVYLESADGTVPALQTEVMERHTDGSIKWLSVSFMWDVEAGEKYPFYLVFNERQSCLTAVSATVGENGAVMKNETLEAQITANGVSQIIYNHEPLLQGSGIRLSINDGSLIKNFTADEMTVVANGPIFSQLRLSGEFADSNMTAEWFITLYQGDDRLYHEIKFTAKGDQRLYGEAVDIELTGDMINRRFEENASLDGDLITSDWLELTGHEGKGVILSSKDVTRFEGALASNGKVNGFYNNLGTSSVSFSPIHFGEPYTWPDGVTRTVRLDMSFYGQTPTEAERERKQAWAFTPPSAAVSAERFVNTGWIDDNNQSPALVRTERLITGLWGKLWHKFEAGKLPHHLEIAYSDYEIVAGTYDRSGGENEYNLWKSYMNSGNSVLFDVLQESAEYWTDFMVYRGEIETLKGTNRYMTMDYDSVSFKTNMPFYGDLSGLYLSYCIAGEPYYKESFQLAADFWEKSIDTAGVPLLSYWYNGLNYLESQSERMTYQFRFCAQVRGLYYAYQLFGDEKYFNAAKRIVDHLPSIQNENGSFYETYLYPSNEPYANVVNDNGELCYSEKIYIMVYGGRMLADFYNLSGYEPTREVISRLGDYLLSKVSDLGYSWSPNADDSVYAVPSIRGAGSASVEFFAKLYKATGEEKYLKAVAKTMRFYLSSWNGGNTDRYMETGKSSFLEVSQTVSRVLKDNRDKVAEMGYADVLALLQDETMERNDLYADFRSGFLRGRNGRLALNAFDTPYGRVVYLNNVELVTYPTYNNTAFTLDFAVSNDTRLWYGETNTVTAEGVRINRDVKVVDMLPLLQTEFSLADLDGEVKAQVLEYTDKKIKVKLTGSGNTHFWLADGYFPIEQQNQYTLTVNDESQTITPVNGMLTGTVTLEAAGTVIEIVPGADITEPQISKITVSGASSILSKGDYIYTASVYDENNRPLSGAEVWWTVSNDSVTIDENGVLRVSAAMSATVTVYAAAGDKTGSLTVSIDIEEKKNSGSTGGGGGGGLRVTASVSQEGTTSQAAQSIVTQPTEAKRFSDVEAGFWAEEAILTLSRRGIINGIDDSRFSPFKQVTRAQLAKLLVETFGIPAATEIVTFADVKPGSWYSDCVSAAQRAGIITGYPDGRFGPEDFVSRQDAAVMLVRAMTYQGVAPEIATLHYADNSSIADYAQEAVAKLLGTGIMNGKDQNRFEPENYMTRAEAAMVFYRALDFIEGR